MRYKYFLFAILLIPALFTDAQQSMSPPVRAHHSLVYDEESKTILLTGGSTPLDGGNSFKFFNDIWSFDGSKWTLKGNAG
ncbi:MAG TPA: kelch repeat-containing protein, partial [Chitinophagaceae bacterium]|nr:kelch repeat-containing protein [Chitinophagaceae bacterium]